MLPGPGFVSFLWEGTFPLHIHTDMSSAVYRCLSGGVEPNRKLSCPNGGSCASIGLAAIANKQRYLSASHCPNHRAPPQLRLVEFSSSTNGPRSAPDPTVASGRNNPFPVTGAGE